MVYTPAKLKMPVIELKTPISKAIGGVFFGCIAVAVLIGQTSSGFTVGGMIVVTVMGAMSLKLLLSAHKHQKYLQSQADELNRWKGL
jgi:hypothetical protein